jgi:hypothetical protein
VPPSGDCRKRFQHAVFGRFRRPFDDCEVAAAALRHGVDAQSVSISSRARSITVATSLDVGCRSAIRHWTKRRRRKRSGRCGPASKRAASAPPSVISSIETARRGASRVAKVDLGWLLPA